MMTIIATAKSHVPSWLQPKAVLVGIAVFNFIVFYLEAKSVEGMMFCFGSPWYVFEMFGYFPLLLLVAALGLYLGRWWSCLGAMASCSPVVYRMVIILVKAASPYDWWWTITFRPSFSFQLVLAVAISIMSFGTMARIMSQKR